MKKDNNVFRLTPRFKPDYDLKDFIAALTPSKGKIEQFEAEFAKKFEAKHAVMFPYGRSGLYLLFKVWQFDGVEIICPAYTCSVVADAIILSGNIPVFVDCQENSFNMSYDAIKSVITQKTRCIVATHLFGYPMDVHKIEQIALDAGKKYGHKIYVVQDAAHCMGAKWQGQMITKFGDAAIFGLGVSKIINSIFGGMVTTNNSETFHNLIEYRRHNFLKKRFVKSLKRFFFMLVVYFGFNSYVYAFTNWLERKGCLNRLVKYYYDNKICFPGDWNDYPLELEARVGLKQLKKYDRIVKKRIDRARKYVEEFGARQDIKILPFFEGATYSHFVALVDDRQLWFEKYRRIGIQLGILIEYVIPYLNAYANYKNKEYPLAQYYSEHVINFPAY